MLDDGVEFDLYHPTTASQPEQGIGERVFAVFRGVWELVSGAAVGAAEPQTFCTVILPICRAVNPSAELSPDNDTPVNAQYNSGYDAFLKAGYVAVSGKNYNPVIVREDSGTIYYRKRIQVRADVDRTLPVNKNAIYTAQPHIVPVLEYIDGNDFNPQDWQETDDESEAMLNWDIGICPTLDWSEVLVPGERLPCKKNEYYEITPPEKYTVEFEGTAVVNEFGVWVKESGFDIVPITAPNGEPPWSFLKIAAYPVLASGSRPEITDGVHIKNDACNTRAYGLWYKTDNAGIRYPILCNVQSLPMGMCIETATLNCIVVDPVTNKCENKYIKYEFEIVRDGTELKLPTVYCAVNCPDKCPP
jgi:hypothetical protein